MDIFGEYRPPQLHKKKSPPQKPKSFLKSFFWTLFKSCLIMGIWGLCALTLVILWFSYDLPSINTLMNSSRKPSVVMQTTDGKIIGTYGDLYEDTVKLANLPPYVYQAVLAIEDRRFYHHFGVDFIGVARALYTNYQADRVVQGASTITQQLSKNFLMTQGMYSVQDRSVRRKIQELIMALWLEWHFTKEQILEIYLNRVYLGSGTYGLDAAAKKYFGRSAKQLNVYQSAVIAGLLKAPSRYSPLANPKLAYERAQVVIHQMIEEGYIGKNEDYLKNAQHDMEAQAQEYASHGTKYFTDWIYEQIPNYVAIDQDLVVVTTLDPLMQRQGENVTAELSDTMGKELNASQIALLSMTPDGAVKVMVGGRSYRKSQFNRTLAKRQPGSTFKIFVYLAALEAGMEPDTLIDDGPVAVQVGNKIWRPSLFKYIPQGEISIRQAFARSVNPVTVRLGQMVTPRKIIEVANRLGITSKMTPDLSITLGAMDASLMQMTSSLATFANQGLAVWPYGIVEIRNKKGQILYMRENKSAIRVIHPHNLSNMRSLLRAVVKEGTGRAASLAEGGKSGSNRNVDAWFIGYGTRYVTGVWVGNDDNTDMKRTSVGGRMPARVWQTFESGLGALSPAILSPSLEEDATSAYDNDALEGLIQSDISSFPSTERLPPQSHPQTPLEHDMESDRNVDDILDQLLVPQ